MRLPVDEILRLLNPDDTLAAQGAGPLRVTTAG
jgi:hypothetical protein